MMLNVDAWVGKWFTYLDIFAYIRMVLLQHVCISCFRLGIVEADKVLRRPISGVVSYRCSFGLSQPYSKSMRQYVSFFPSCKINCG